MNRTLLLLTSAVALTACDTFSSKDPLPGKRESIFVQASTVKQEIVGGKASLSLKNEVRNKDWSVPGGTLSHSLDNLALNKDLKKLWSTSIGYGSSSQKRLISNIIVHNDTIFTMDTHGMIKALKFQDGSNLWSANTSPEGLEANTLGGGICVNTNTVFVTTSFGDIIALDGKTGKELWKQSLQTPFRIAPTLHRDHVIAINVANEAYALDIKTGEVKWNHIGLPEATGLLGGGVPAIEGDKIIVPHSTGEIYALSAITGQPLWVEALNPATAFDPLSSISHIRARPIIYQGKVYAISHGGRMAAFDLNNGTRYWQKDVGGLRTPAIVDGYIFMISNDNDLVCLDTARGQIVWAQPLKHPAGEEKVNWAGPLMAGGKLILTNSTGHIVFINPLDGKELTAIDHGDNIGLSPVVVDGKLLILSESGTLTVYG
ncbi:MAG: PQQ-binding-like beta-propeller repeat protein [Candidatus Paracaedibacteraceae bacterium]|nr:PQQ-binding-like beta-propeller repeat protein [Candidatus Paracaedibacteraceae bacterium]